MGSYKEIGTAGFYCS